MQDIEIILHSKLKDENNDDVNGFINLGSDFSPLHIAVKYFY